MNSVSRWQTSFRFGRCALLHLRTPPGMPPKRKKPTASSAGAPQKRALSSPTSGRASAKQNRVSNATTPPLVTPEREPSKARRVSSRLASSTSAGEGVETCPGVIDRATALSPSPDAENECFTPRNYDRADQPRQNGETTQNGKKNTAAEKTRTGVDNSVAVDPELVEEEGVPLEELQEALGRPSPVNSGYLPLPWKGRIGYVRPHTAVRLNCKTY